VVLRSAGGELFCGVASKSKRQKAAAAAAAAAEEAAAEATEANKRGFDFAHTHPRATTKSPYWLLAPQA
jgi:hypothetical protein